MKRPPRKAVEFARGNVVDARVRFGQPTIKGTRVPVSVLLDELAAGSENKEISRDALDVGWRPQPRASRA